MSWDEINTTVCNDDRQYMNIKSSVLDNCLLNKSSCNNSVTDFNGLFKECLLQFVQLVTCRDKGKARQLKYMY